MQIPTSEEMEYCTCRDSNTYIFFLFIRFLINYYRAILSLCMEWYLTYRSHNIKGLKNIVLFFWHDDYFNLFLYAFLMDYILIYKYVCTVSTLFDYCSAYRNLDCIERIWNKFNYNIERISLFFNVRYIMLWEFFSVLDLYDIINIYTALCMYVWCMIKQCRTCVYLCMYVIICIYVRMYVCMLIYVW